MTRTKTYMDEDVLDVAMAAVQHLLTRRSSGSIAVRKAALEALLGTHPDASLVEWVREEARVALEEAVSLARTRAIQARAEAIQAASEADEAEAAVAELGT